MTTLLDTLAPLARAAVPASATPFAPEHVLWQETLPGGMQWSGLMRRGTSLRLVDIDGRANVAALMYHFSDRHERYNMPDTLKTQRTAYLRAGHVLYSDMGRILASITADTAGWHDTVGGTLDASAAAAKYGATNYQQQRNAMHRNAADGLLIELGKWGLGARDIVPNLNFFSKLAPDADGQLRFDSTHRAPGQMVELRFEMDTLLVMSAAPHPFDPAPAYAPGAVQMTAWRSGTAPADDPCRMALPENERGFANTERHYL